MQTLIMKFGGSTVGTTMALTQLASIVLHEREHWERLLIVVSALDGITDQLIEAAHLAQLANRRGYRRIVANLRTRHLALIDHLLSPNERTALLSAMDNLLYDMLERCQHLSDQSSNPHPDALDAIIGVGERLAARIVAALLRDNGLRSVAIDTTDIIITDNTYTNATPEMRLTRERIETQLLPLLGRGILPVITGFIGATSNGIPTTLGRGGSDFTASILGTCSDASQVWIWTDVDGMMTADPAEIQSASTIETLSYEEAGELAYFGARILHSRMIGLLREHNIPLRVRNIYSPRQPGTSIQKDSTPTRSGLQAVTSIPAIALQMDGNGSLAQLTAIVDEVFVQQTGIPAETMIASQSPGKSLVCFVVPTTVGQDAAHTLQIALQDALQHSQWIARIVTVVTAVGAGIQRSQDLSARLLLALHDIPLLAISANTGQCSLSVVLDSQMADEAIHRIHNLIVEYTR
jgi:aspartate kinase